MAGDGAHRPFRQERAVGPCEVGRLPELAGGDGQEHGQLLAAVLLGEGQRRPAAIAELMECLGEARRHPHAVVVDLRAGLVASHVGGGDDLLGEAPRLAQGGANEVWRRLLAARQGVDLAPRHELFEHEPDVLGGCAVIGHIRSGEGFPCQFTR